jgi:hypothetical protein
MPDAEQATADRTVNGATIAAMADVLAAIGSGGAIMEWADEAPVGPLPAGRAVAATGVTIGHGRIRLRDSAPPAYVGDDRPAPVAQPEAVGHGQIRLRSG